MPKDILAISNHGTMLGGGEYSFLDLLSRLQGEWNFLGVVPKDGELAHSLRLRGIETRVVPLPSIRPWLVAHILASLKKYLTLCRNDRPVLIYANGSRAAFYGGVIGRLTKTPTIWHCRIADKDIFLDFVLSRLSTKIITNSMATANRFKHNLSDKIKVVNNGIDIRWLRNDSVRKPELIDQDWRVILVVARVSRWKRHDLALSAFELIAKSNPDCHLVCLGPKDASDPEWWDNLQDITRRSVFSNRIHWIGQVEDVRPWYRAATVLVLASENEPFGRVLVEAMACGVPVVAARTGGIPEIVRDGRDGILAEPGEVAEIADAMEKILKDEDLRERYARSARERAEYFSLDAHVDKMTEVFEDTIKK